MSYAECLQMEIGMAWQSFHQGDFVEGIRAMIIDKDNAPRWRPAAVEEVSAEDVARIFENPWAESEHPLSDLKGKAVCK